MSYVYVTLPDRARRGPLQVKPAKILICDTDLPICAF